MIWHDVTLPLTDAQPTWPGDDPFVYTETGTIEKGDHSNCASLSMSTHFGTHVDAPYHFITEGAPVDQLDLDLLMGPCLVVSAEAVEGPLIEQADLVDKVPADTRRLLVKTKHGKYLGSGPFRKDLTAFSPACAEWLVNQGVRLLGIDYFSIGAYENPQPTHAIFLGAGGVAVENVDLRQIEPGAYHLICLPMKIQGSGGASARVLLGKQ